MFRGLAETTIDRYMKLVRQFVKAVGKEKNFTREDIVKHLAKLRMGGAKNNYLRYVMITLKRFYKANKCAWDFDKMDLPRKEEPNRPMYTLEEEKRILKVAKEKGTKPYAIVRLSVHTGIRRIEIKNLNLKDFHPPTLFVKTAKHGKPRDRELDNETIRAVQEYLATRKGKAKEHPALFLASHRNPRRFSLSGLSKLLRVIRKEAGVHKPAGYHGARRTFVTQGIESGITESDMKDYMGWKSRKAMDAYILLNPRKVRKRVRRMHPFLSGAEIEEIKKEKLDL